MKPDKSRALPTRFIDCRTPSAPRLVVSENLDDTPVPYVALSYVWGDSISHCTGRENYKTYLKGIDYDTIPQTIRDAIKVTHDLGMRYIWIDAFCIIQDCEKDKKRELAKMGSIYQNAHFTLIASSAPGGDAGFLQDRTLPPHYRIPYYRSDGHLGSVYVGRRGYTAPSVVPGKEPVDRRAWCFQEWLLSPRKLLYTSDTLRYHCQTIARPVEDSIRAIRTVQSFVLDHAFLPIERAILANPDLAELSSEEHFARQCMLWGLIVSNYTQRRLSCNTDRLPAFMAIAEQFDAIWQPEWHPGRYVAGLWEKFLPRDLLWYRELAGHAWQDDSLRPRPAEYLAPSWAWPSVDGHVITRAGATYDRGSNDACKVQKCSITLLDEGLPYGRVSAGYLKLSAM
ncbi:heterokaryon incompatibility protein-domain-containing protein, partial [Trametes maxima]